MPARAARGHGTGDEQKRVSASAAWREARELVWGIAAGSVSAWG